MTTLKEFIEERSFVQTDRISTQVRIIGVGLLATTWSLLLGEVDSLRDIILQCRPHFIIIGTIAMIALAFDYLQYLFSYLNIKKTLSKMESQNIIDTNYDYDGAKFILCDILAHFTQREGPYQLSKWFFVGKQIVLLTIGRSGLLYFVICMFFIMFN